MSNGLIGHTTRDAVESKLPAGSRNRMLRNQSLAKEMRLHSTGRGAFEHGNAAPNPQR